MHPHNHFPLVKRERFVQVVLIFKGLKIIHLALDPHGKLLTVLSLFLVNPYFLQLLFQLVLVNMGALVLK